MTLASDGSRPSALVTGELDGMHEFKKHSSRQRGLFPLPCENDVKHLPSGLSRGCRQRAGRRRELSTRVSEMARALNSPHGVEDFPTATRTSLAQDATRRILYRAAEAFSPPVSRVQTQEALRALCVVPPFTAMAAALHLPCRAPRVARFQRAGHSCARPRATRRLRTFGGAQGEDSLSSEEFKETVGSEGPARVHIDPALKRAGVCKRFIWRLVSLGMVRLSSDSECECRILCVWKKNGTQRLLWMPEVSTSGVDDPHQCDSVLEMVWLDLNSRPRCIYPYNKQVSTTVFTG